MSRWTAHRPRRGRRCGSRTTTATSTSALALYDSDPDAIRRSILHREGRIDQDDNVRIALDTYPDRRSAYIFELNPFGTQGDALFTDESMTLSDWNWEGVYESEARITDDGWMLEVAVPFTTIRFSDDDAPSMGLLIERTIRRKNEVVYFPHIGQEFRSGLTQVSQYATLSGLEDLRRGRYMELQAVRDSAAPNRFRAKIARRSTPLESTSSTRSRPT